MDTITRLQKENCFANGKLLRLPEWLGWEELQELVAAGLLIRKFYKNLYGHVDYVLPEQPRPAAPENKE